MKFISHRGNISGKNIELENSPDYIIDALAKGYDVEIDLRMVGEKFFLGHDSPDYEVSIGWIQEKKDRLYIHAKTIETAVALSSLDGMNFFFHTDDACTITSMGMVWVHPISNPVPGAIFVMPEYRDIKMDALAGCSGICSDDVLHYQRSYNEYEVVHHESKRQKDR